VAGVPTCGGKGFHLARLARYGFRVPRGGVLPVGAAIGEIRAGLTRLGLSETLVAVRSSATAEDSVGASFAGIHKSFLNVSGVGAVEEAARGCLESLRSPEAVAYRQRMGIKGEVAGAVVICEMVPARAAGVAFSCDPATGRRDLILIDAAEGLGDAVVSGRVNPQRMLWRRERGVITRLTAGSLQAEALLPQKIEQELVHLVARVHWALGEGQNPQDLEWAYDGERLWLLQARPVTRVSRTAWAPLAAMPRYWSTANIKDAVPGVVCELSWSLLSTIVEGIAYGVMQAARYQTPPGLEVVRRFQGRGFFDLSLMQWAFYDAFGMMPADVVKVVGGQQPAIEVPRNPLKGAAGRRRAAASLRLLRTIWNYPARSRATIEGMLEYQRQLRDEDWSKRTRAELHGQLTEIAARQHTYSPVAGLANASSGPWQLTLEGLVGNADLVARLMAGTRGVASAEQGYRVYEMACGEATMADFLREFGHRAVYEADIANPRWYEDPSWIEEQVRLLQTSPLMRDPRETAAEIRHAAEQEIRKKFGWRSGLVFWLVRKMREGTAARELAKSALVALLLPIRKIALEIGRRLVEEGRLDAPVQALDLTIDDLECWLRGYWDGAGARELTRGRAARRSRWLAEDSPDLVTEAPDGSMVATAPVAVGGDGWSGIAISPGIASGRARIVRTPLDATGFEQGDILVAPSTDPGWTPLFLRAGAIVMETGGFLSHGAIVAREYGIPAVANVPGILAALRDGESITVDGSRGRVTRKNGPGGNGNSFPTK
jgi:phosphohistidine swiveling domain-containing protein